MNRTGRNSERVSCLTAILCLAPPCAAAGHIWVERPADYPRINRVQAAAGAVTYTVDLSGFFFSTTQSLPPQAIAGLEEAVVRAFEKWNEVLEPVGLRFERRPIGTLVDIPVFALAYDRFLPPDVFGETVAGSLAFPLNSVMNFSPIVFNADHPFEALDLRPTVTDGGLHHPYLRYVDLDGICMYTTTMHEIGHQFGIGHPQEMFALGRNFGFLGLDTVQVDPECLTPSDFVSGEDLRRRGRILPTEIDSILAPLQIGATATDLPPEDRAAVAFILRALDPPAADEMLDRARELFRTTNPLRFANVVTEYEFQPGVGSDNNTRARATPAEPGTIILGSIARPVTGSGTADRDYYRFSVSDADAGMTWIFDIDLGGGLSGANWVDAVLEIQDSDGTVLAANDDALELDPGSISTADPFLTWIPAQGGTYFVCVAAGRGHEEPGGIGDYELKIGIGSVPKPTGQAPEFTDPSVGSCEFQPIPAQPLAPLCGGIGLLFPMMEGIALLGLISHRRRRRVQRGWRLRRSISED